MSAESPRHARSGGPLTVPSQPPSDRSIIDAVSGFINDVTLSSSSNVDPKDVIQWARFETADINEPTPEGDGDHDITPLLLILGYGSGVQVWLIPPNGEAQEVLSWRQGTVRVLRILPTPQHGDSFASKRPLIALCDSASPGPTFCSLSFISIRGGEQVKSIKFKNPILDVLANKRSVVVSFSERFAVFDADTLEDRMAITTCYPCPCPLGGSMPINPLALGDRWLAYADKKLNQSKRSSGGCEGEGVTSYTATVLHAAKSLSKGLRGLGESVAHSLAGGRSTSQSPSPPNADIQQPGVVTIVDIEGNDEEEGQDSDEQIDPIVAHFVAHSEAIIALKFDASGMLLVTADRRGHDFHVFRINPHPCGPSLASVHHLYILHRGDTTAKVQDIAISGDSRWAAISTLRGTTHVFAISPYGGPCGVRTHTQPRVVNRLSRFHRSAGLPIHAHAHSKRASGSPVGEGLSAGSWFPNPRLPPYPLPTTSSPLAQIRPTANLPTHTITRTSSGRQRLSSLSEDSGAAPLLARARFGPACAPAAARPAPAAAPAPAPLAALYLMAANGALLHLALNPRPLTGVPKEKICDESPIELQVEGVAQWMLQRPAAAADLLAPLPPANPLLRAHPAAKCSDICMSEEERWLSQVEIVTHAGPHRRLWMGPQFVFKTYNLTGSSSSLSEAETVEVDTSAARGVARSNPVNMPGVRPIVPVLIDSGSASSLEHSPSDSFRRKSLLSESGRAASLCDVQLKEDLAEAMKEDHGWREQRRDADADADSAGVVARAVDPLGCVVQARAAAAPPPPPLDPDRYTRENRDEATFRPVVRAPAALPPAALLLRPLPRTTTIPVQPLPCDARAAPPASPLPLDTRRLIPAAAAALGDCADDAREPLPDDVPTLPETARSSDIQAASVDESPTRPSFGLESGDDSYKFSECERVCDAAPSGSSVIESEVASKVCTDVEVPAEARVTENKSSIELVGSEVVEKSKSEVPVPVPARSSKRSGKSKGRNGPDDPVERSSDAGASTTKLNKLTRDKSSPTVKSSKRETKSTPRGHVDSPGVPSKCLDEVSHLAEVPTESICSASSSKKVEDRTVSSLDRTADNKDSKSGGHKISTPSKKHSKESSSVREESNRPAETLMEALSCTPAQELSSEKCFSSTKSSEKTEGKSYERKSMLTSSKRSSKESSPMSNEAKRFTETMTEVLSRPTLTEKLFDTFAEKTSSIKRTEEREYKSGVSKTGSTFLGESEEHLACFDESETQLEHFTEDLSCTSLAAELREASQEKSIPYIKCSQKDDIMESKMESSNISRAIKSTKLSDNEIKTEDQAWDMLNEPDKSSKLSVSPTMNIGDKSEESRSKSKRNRKVKKSLEDAQAKSDENSFVEIHAIEEKQQPPCDDLVAISSPFEDVDKCSSYVGKNKKWRSSKGQSPEKMYEVDQTEGDINVKNETDVSCNVDMKTTDVDILSISTTTKCIADVKSKNKSLIVPHSVENFDTNIELLKTRKSKSLSPYADSRRVVENLSDSDIKDVYVIDTTSEEFPEIQITRGSKLRKKSPQLAENKDQEKQPHIEKPVKSWSSIAASKSIKKVNEPEYEKQENLQVDIKNVENIDKVCEYNELTSGSDVSSKGISLHEKLYELCKRRDILVAECDAPSELNFVEEHHAVVHDLPPLEPLNFGLDDFKLEVMRDSLLEVNETKLTSPICKINIDDILSSLKESTTKGIDSSTFNLIDLEKVPAKKEKGFSVVQTQKITSQEIKLEDDIKTNERESEVMEKSSDDDNTPPIISTESDKIAVPSVKQQTKAKKSRRKKK